MLQTDTDTKNENLPEKIILVLSSPAAHCRCHSIRQGRNHKGTLDK